MKVEKEIIKKLLKMFEEHSGLKIKYSKLRNYLTEQEIEHLKQLNVLKCECICEKQRTVNRDGKVLKIEKRGDKILLIDIKDFEVVEEIPIEDVTDCDIDSKSLGCLVLNLVFDKVDTLNCCVQSAFINISAKVEDRFDIVLLLQHIRHPSLDKVLIEIGRYARERIPVLVIVSSETFEVLLEHLSYIAVGSLIKVTTYSGLAQEDEINDIREWLNHVYDVIELEKDILSKNVKDESFKKLVLSVDTNPKYLVTIMYTLKTLKRLKPKSKETWRLLENLVALSLAIIYGGDPFKYGHKDIGERVPGGVFVVRDGEGKIRLIGLIDAKSSKRGLRLSLDDVPKYLSYLKSIRRKEWVNEYQKVVLYFISFDTCKAIQERWNKEDIDEGIKGFYNVIHKQLKTNEYIVIIPLDSLLTIIDSFLSVIRRIKISLAEGGYSIFNDIIEPDEGNKAMKMLRDKLFCLDTERLKEYLNEKMNRKSVITEIFDVS